ncbi:hypothetical protein KPH14_002152 [Odynerus spinipes]|uniref:C2H2-type domain-containing protein n=1 Tax=Odynerus spinipes TaxID=1348599 RepID=A0AAD9RL75_9HYME|nr:hypothetical protein KPH14_002152 [Odynerus spinipes]
MECKKQYVCKYAGCNASYLKPSQLSRHTRLHTGEKPYKCNHPGCSKAYTNSSHLKRHAETHNLIKKRLQCNKCFLTISNYHNLKRHYTRVHSDNVLTCNECNMAFKKKHQLIQHIATHCGYTSFKCGKCNKIYTNIRRLKRHETTHEKEQKRYPCQVPECSEVFDKWTLLCKHEKTEHVIDYKCDQCGKKFSTKARLKYHFKIHEKDRPFIPCPYDECNRKYVSESNLKSHIKVYHLGQKFICDICKMGLSSQRKLKEHIMRIHEGKTKKATSRRSERRKRKDAVNMAATNFKTLSEEDIIAFFNSFDTVLTDCDGVLWMHMTPLRNASTVLSKLHALGNRIFYITNNSTKTREEFVEKCRKLKFKASKDNILCTANLSANYLHKLGFCKKAYVIGSEAITKELEELGISHCGVGPDVINVDVPGSYMAFNKDPDVGAVIVGFDEHFSYPKMVKAATYLNDPNVHFIGTNTDERFPVAQSIVVPGTGSLVRCIESCAERKAVIMGKPESYIANMLKEKYNVNPARTLMIGDRCNTDILLGTRCGFKTLLVLTGVTTLQQVEDWKQSDKPEEKELVPDYYIDALGDLLDYIELFMSKSEKNTSLENSKTYS